VPDFPNTENPSYAEWKKFFEKKYLKYLKSNSVIIAHSLGCQFAIRFLREKNLTIESLILVSPPLNDCGISEISDFF